MRRLILIRHAKSSWDFPLLGDFERPLNARGRRDAPLMAKRLAASLQAPWRFVSSPALRAITTAHAFADVFDVRHVDIRIETRLYEATPGTLLHVVNSLDDTDGQVLMFGHNPGFTELAQLLALVSFAELPTCAIVDLSFDCTRWQDITPDSGYCLNFLYPKQGSD